MRQSLARFSGSVSSIHAASSVDCITTMVGFKVFGTHTKYMVRRRDPPSQGWRTFLRNHADGIAAMDMFVVPTISFRLLYGLLIMGHGRRQIVWLGVTAHPTAEWIANQITEAFGWEKAPRCLIPDRDRASSDAFDRWAFATNQRHHAP